MSDDQPSRARRLLQSIRKEIPEALAEGRDHDDAEVAAMLRELGIALVECEQPTQLVAARLLAIAKKYTSETVRVVVLPTALVVQIGTVADEVETIVKPKTQLNLAGRIDGSPNSPRSAPSLRPTRPGRPPPRAPCRRGSGPSQLMLLVFGVGLGMHIAGRVAPQQPSPQMGGWSLYVAVIVIAIGLYIYLSRPGDRCRG